MTPAQRRRKLAGARDRRRREREMLARCDAYMSKGTRLAEVLGGRLVGFDPGFLIDPKGGLSRCRSWDFSDDMADAVLSAVERYALAADVARLVVYGGGR